MMGSVVRRRRSSLPLLTVITAAIATAIAVAQPLVAQQTGAAAPLVFDGVTVIDVESGARVPDQRVVVTGTRITAIGLGEKVKVPAGAQVVDAKGKFLVPGFWDMHIHPGPWYPVFYPLFLANGVTAVRDAAAAIPLDTLRAWRRGVIAGEHVGPARILLSGQSISERADCDRRTVTTKHMTCVLDAADARHLVDSLKAAGADLVKPYIINTPEVYYALVSEARKQGMLAAGHLQIISAAEAADSGVALIDHVNTSGGLDSTCVTMEDPSPLSVERCRPSAEDLRRHNTWLAPTMVILVQHSVAERGSGMSMFGNASPRSEAILNRAKEHLTAFWNNPAPAAAAASDRAANWLRGPTVRDTVGLEPPSKVGYLHVAQEAGLPMVVGTDASGGRSMFEAMAPGWGAHEEMAMMVAEGMTPLAALQAGTLNPAKAMRLADSLGTVAEGKLADLVLLDADPLADITNTTTIRAVVANGRYFDRKALDTVLDDVRKDKMTARMMAE